MAQVRQTVLNGISEVGAFRSAADESFGSTAEDGVTITFSGNDLEVRSGQSGMIEKLIRTADTIDVTVRLLFSDLLAVRDMLGIPAASLTGDLSLSTDEVLAIVEGELGSVQDHIYVETPGPGSLRRYDFHVCRLRAGLTIQHSKNAPVILEATWTVLRNPSGNEVTITDSP